MTHKWFRPNAEALDALNEQYDIIVLRKFDSWRNMLRLRNIFMKLIADHLTLHMMSMLQERLLRAANGQERLSWSQLAPEIIAMVKIPNQLQNVNKAFGENEHHDVINVADICNAMCAWRRKRVREVLWQVFARSKAVNGVMPAEACAEGLTSSVLHVWSQPCRVLDIVLPSPQQQGSKPGKEAGKSSEPERKPEELIGVNKRTVTFLELVAKTDAADVL